MEHRVMNIMRSLSEDFGVASHEVGDNKFELNTDLSRFDHRTVLKLEVSSDIIRTELNHFFGKFNMGKSVSVQELFHLLLDNSDCFRNTCAYLGIEMIDKTPYVTLNAYHHFLTKWEDRDIADMIQIQIVDIIGGLDGGRFPDSIYEFLPRK